MHTFDFEGLSIAYEHAGEGDPVLFLHNLGGNRGIWRHQVGPLAATNSVYALDWFGYGDSSTPADGYTVDRHLRLLEAFAGAHGLDDLTLVGNCFGSAMALEYARRHPATVRALVLVNPLTGATLRPTRSGLAARTLRHLPLRPVAAHLRLPEPVAGLVVREQFGARGRGDRSDPGRALRTRWTRPRSLVAIQAILPELDRLSDLDELRLGPDFPPITTIWGEQNRVLSAAAGQRLNETLCPWSAITVPECGHLVMLEDPDTVTAAVTSALADRSQIR